MEMPVGQSTSFVWLKYPKNQIHALKCATDVVPRAY